MRKVLFTHIPRTAGRSIRFVVEDGRSFSYQRFPRKRVWFREDVDFTYIGHQSIHYLVKTGLMPKEFVDSCFKFAFVRNPWDRLVSVYNHYRSFRLKRPSNKPSNPCLANFRTFIDVVVSGKWVRGPNGTTKITRPYFDRASPQSEWLRYKMDFVGKFETLNEDWLRICDLIGIKPIELSTKKKAETRPNYRPYYDENLRMMVGEYCHEVIDGYGYEF